MTHLHSTSEFLVIGMSSNIRVFSLIDGSCLLTYSHVFDKDVTDGKNNVSMTRMEDVVVSPDAKSICALFSDKRLMIWDSDKWQMKREMKMKRRSTALAFDPNMSWMFVADKSGDLYQYTIKYVDATNENIDDEVVKEPVLAHVSMLLDVEITGDGKYILTADRDEKVRVSLLEKPYVIESFCLGHSDFVCSLLSLPSSPARRGDFFISGSGDGNICMWDPSTGQEINRHTFSLNDTNTTNEKEERVNSGNFIPSLLTCSRDGNLFSVASSQANQSFVYVFNIDWKEPNFNHAYTIPIPDSYKLLGITFCPSQDDKNVLYVMSLIGNGKFVLTAYNCQKLCFSQVNSEVIQGITSQISSLTYEDNDIYEGLFKTRADGPVYASYIKKKEERLLMKEKREFANDNDSASKRSKSEEITSET